MGEFDVLVIGAGPGGYVCAIRSAQLGLKTAVVEREALGGVCLNVGCIPSKALITAGHWLEKMKHTAPEMGIKAVGGVEVDFSQLQRWKDSVCRRMSGGVEQLLAGNGVTVLKGEARFVSANRIEVRSGAGVQTVNANHFVIATGSRPIAISGFAYDEKTILSSTGALALKEAPKRFVVVGGGYIGLEIGSCFAKFGSRVTVIEASDALLKGAADPECAQIVARKLKKSGVEVRLSAQAKSWKPLAGGGATVTITVGGKDEVIDADAVLVTVGRRPNSEDLGLESAGVKVDARGFVIADPQRRTSAKGIFAIGDVAGQPMLAHKASHEGVLVAEVISGKNRAYDAKTVPAVIFVDPEIASAGLTEEEARAKGHGPLKVAKFPFAANGRAVSMMEAEGFVKMVADESTHVLLGVQIVGPEASNLISEAALAIEMGARLEDLSLTIHPHPTLGETLMEAAEATIGHAIHVIQNPRATGSGAKGRASRAAQA